MIDNKPTSPLDWPKIKVYGSDFTKDLHAMYDAITELELWDYICDNPPDENKGYMFGSDENIQRIGNHQKVIASGHSGATYAYSMRIMQLISKIGFSKFKAEYNLSQLFFL